MNTFIIIFIIIAVAGILILNGKSPVNKKPREEILKQIAKFCEGSLEQIDDEAYPNSYRITFRHEGQEFVYEDWEKQGFKDKVYTANLSAQTTGKFTLTFQPKERSNKIRTDIFIASNVHSNMSEDQEYFDVPPFLKNFSVNTNDNRFANEYFNDGKISAIYKYFKRTDSWNNDVMPIQIVDGKVILEFFTAGELIPNIRNVYNDIPLIENYTNRLIILAKRIKDTR